MYQYLVIFLGLFLSSENAGIPPDGRIDSIFAILKKIHTLLSLHTGYPGSMPLYLSVNTGRSLLLIRRPSESSL